MMYRVYRMYLGRKLEVGTYASEKEARKVIARKDSHRKYSFIEKIK